MQRAFLVAILLGWLEQMMNEEAAEAPQRVILSRAHDESMALPLPPVKAR